MKNLVLIMALVAFCCPAALAQESSEKEELFKNLTYPELEVTPLASERLRREAQNEAKTRWVTHLPFQVSALSTFIAGFYGLDKMDPAQKRDGSFPDHLVEQNREAAYSAMAVGGGWLTATVLLSAYYTPYLDGYKDIRKQKGDSKRKRLTRERLAEESLAGPAKLAHRMKWMSVSTNFLASVFMATQTNEGGSLVAAGSALLALTPMVFESRWTQVHETHQRYKKRIYGPVSQVFVVPGENGSRRLAGGLGVHVSF